MKKNCFVETIGERCRRCYTCVRECPSKAIRIQEGQAGVIPERCVGCGNCVRVCSQNAKRAVGTAGEVGVLLSNGRPTAACIAPSFPAEFSEITPETLVGMVRSLGFDYVHEVGFGADLVAARYRDLMDDDQDGRRHIATTCPAIIAYVEKYVPSEAASLVPIVSPMVATGRALKRVHGNEVQSVFIGPCIAKKREARSPEVGDAVAEALTFAELREMFQVAGLEPHAVEASEFDPPRAGLGAIFPVSRGLLQNAGVKEDLVSSTVVATDGRQSFVDALKEFQSKTLDVRLLEVLACNGCIMGAGMATRAPKFSRQSRISAYTRRRLQQADQQAWRESVASFSDLDLSRGFHAEDQRFPEPDPETLRNILAQMGKHEPEDELNCGACGYDTCREHAIATHKGLAESEMCLPFSVDQLHQTVEELRLSHEQLASAQTALMQSEKLASMGQLAAGIAHEVNNPLGVVLMYAHLLLDEQEGESPMREDLAMIAEQADRCKKIVSRLLHFARQNKIFREQTDVIELLQRSTKPIIPPDGIEVIVSHDIKHRTAEIDRDQMLQVLTNLITNACDAMPDGGRVRVAARDTDAEVIIEVSDSGIGIAEEHRTRIFDPFFTTKQIGVGTGLGLAVTYGIVKMHCGDIRVESNTDPEKGPTGTTFILSLPRHQTQESPASEDARMTGGLWAGDASS
ncbi:MAG: [Fe-Fe] hydrogenase large subunit C-terminal domain-containing protein [Planctomycetota bacterium]